MHFNKARHYTLVNGSDTQRVHPPSGRTSLVRSIGVIWVAKVGGSVSVHCRQEINQDEGYFFYQAGRILREGYG